MRKMVSFALLATTLGCGGNSGDSEVQPAPPPTQDPAPAEPAPLRERASALFEALPVEVEVDENKRVLGRSLFHDNRLSGDSSLSCATCHSLSHGGAEPRRVSTGIRGQQGPINSPTVLNAVYNFRQFWDGRAADLREQAEGPVVNSLEMGGDWDVILTRLREDEAYPAQFEAAYGSSEAVTHENVIDAIVEYERSLVTPSDFDRWLGGDEGALTDAEQAGLERFIQLGCTSCHRGRNLGGDSYQRMGLVNNYFERRGGPITEADLGRYNVTEEEADRHNFKVPTLRNVNLTAPYFHDGSAATLADAVRTMANVQLGLETLPDAQVDEIVAFLESLEGDLPPGSRPPGARTDASTSERPDAESGAPADVRGVERSSP